MSKGLPMALALCLLGLPCAAQDGAGGGPVNGNGAPGAGMPVSDQGQQQPGQSDQQGQQGQPDQQGQPAQQGQMDQPQQGSGEAAQVPDEGGDTNTYNPEEMAPSAENPAAPPAALPKPAAPAPDAGQSVAPAGDQAAAAAPAKTKRHGKAKAKPAQKPADDSSAAKTAVAKSDIPPVPLTPVTPSNP